MNNKWKPLTPSGFITPHTYKTEKFIVKTLGVTDIVEDFDAVMTSIVRLKGTFDFYPEWPNADMSLEEDLSNLGWHQTEFALGSSFAYSVRTVKDNKYIGCFYIFPSNSDNHQIDAYVWVRESYKNLDEELFVEMKKWLDKAWPFKKTLINFPGR